MNTLLRLWRTLDGVPWREALLAEWQERLREDLPLVREHLSPTGELGTTYPCPNGAGDGCPRQVHERGGGVFEAVCGNLPAECEPLRLRKSELAVHRLDEPAALGAEAERVRLWECLEPAGVEAYAGLLPIGRLVRRAGSALVVLATSEQAKARGAVLELQRRAGTDRAVVLVAGRWEDQCSPEGVVELALTEPERPRLHRAVKLLWPEAWAGRAKDRDGIFEEVTLEIGTSDERHVVRLNGNEVHGFDHSDLKLARLLLLTTTRALDLDPERGGWLKKDPVLELDEKEEDLGALRKAFWEDLPDDFARLSRDERKALIGTSLKPSGRLRLALHPRNVRLDESLRGLRLLGERQSEASEPELPSKKKSARGKTAGVEAHRSNMAQARNRAQRIFEAARKAGAPLPTTAELTVHS